MSNIFNDKIKVHTAPSGTQYVNSIDLLLTEEEREQLYQRAEREASKLERFTIKERELLCEWMELYMSNIHPNAFYKEADYYRMLEIVNILKQSPPPFAEATEGRQWKDSGEEGE